MGKTSDILLLLGLGVVLIGVTSYLRTPTTLTSTPTFDPTLAIDIDYY